MSDLSWLNPTPHAIAVYASRPPSPGVTQHSLPSGRYSLLGPDFHRLDRTSFAWRTHSNHPSPPKATMLFAVELPSRGGDTQYVNMHTKQRIDGLKAVHVYQSKFSPRPLGGS